VTLHLILPVEKTNFDGTLVAFKVFLHWVKCVNPLKRGVSFRSRINGSKVFLSPEISMAGFQKKDPVVSGLSL